MIVVASTRTYEQADAMNSQSNSTPTAPYFDRRRRRVSS